jgi:RNA polymerase sigma-70 factor (ECF subfamily)
LHEEAGLDLDEIAVITGSNRETTKSRLRYAVNKLRVAIDEPAAEMA